MSEKLQDGLSYPPRGMRAERAAAYVGIGRTKFLELVEKGVLPEPIEIDGMTLWDRLTLDAAFDNLQNQPQRRNSFDVITGMGK